MAESMLKDGWPIAQSPHHCSLRANLPSMLILARLSVYLCNVQPVTCPACQRCKHFAPTRARTSQVLRPLKFRCEGIWKEHSQPSAPVTSIQEASSAILAPGDHCQAACSCAGSSALFPAGMEGSTGRGSHAGLLSFTNLNRCCIRAQLIRLARSA